MNTKAENSLVVRRYTASDVTTWNTFVDKSSNGTFLFKREFMEYHSDKFEDFSYLIWRGVDLIALFVAGRSYTTAELATLIAHPGLTYGGLVHTEELKYPILQECYVALLEVFRAQGFAKLLIKPVARVFCRNHTEASLFLFFQTGFILLRRELNSVVDLTKPLRISKGRKDNIRKARNFGIIIEETIDFSSFWPILVDNLWQAHGVRPPHSEKEIALLKNRFPQNIRLFVATHNSVVLGGILLFLDSKCGFVHTQYISANEQGKAVGAVDAIIAHVLNLMQCEFPRFSFGISTSQGEINLGLLAQKEGFGAHVEILDTYEKQLD